MNGADKLFKDICEKPVLAHSLTAFQICDLVNEIIIVTREDCISLVSDICEKYDITKASKIIVGGEKRLHSVTNGVYTISEKAEIVAIHDGARPCVSQDIIKNTIISAKRNNAAAPAVPVISTIKRVHNSYITETIDRQELYEIQTPQVFDADLIKAALANANEKKIDATDDCSIVELLGATVYITDGSRNNIKLTTSEDMIIAEAIINSR